MKIKLPSNVIKIINRLSQKGFECYIVGGSLRNILLEADPCDYDLATNAKPRDVLDIFSDYKILKTGIKHGTVSVVIDDEVYEITTYRIDGKYPDNRHPGEVKYTDSLKLDLSRRDFTVNAMAYNPKSGLVDYFNGKADISNKILRCVGDPDLRFREDGLRILRGLRFSAVYDFVIDTKTANGITKNKELLNNISPERIGSEFIKLLCGNNVGYVLHSFRDVFAVIIPELQPMFDFDQENPHHDKTLWDHTINAVENIENTPVLRMTMLLHDICKPAAVRKDKSGISHYHNHDVMGAGLAEKILKNLRYPNAFINEVSILIYYHDMRIKPDMPNVRRALNILGDENFVRLMKIQHADTLAQSEYKRNEKIENYNRVCRLYKEIIDNNLCYSVKQLEVKGGDLINLGITDGKKIGETLDYLLELVITEKCPNNKRELLNILR